MTDTTIDATDSGRPSPCNCPPGRHRYTLFDPADLAHGVMYGCANCGGLLCVAGCGRPVSERLAICDSTACAPTWPQAVP